MPSSQGGLLQRHMTESDRDFDSCETPSSDALAKLRTTSRNWGRLAIQAIPSSEMGLSMTLSDLRDFILAISVKALSDNSELVQCSASTDGMEAKWPHERSLGEQYVNRNILRERSLASSARLGSSTTSQPNDNCSSDSKEQIATISSPVASRAVAVRTSHKSCSKPTGTHELGQ